MPEVRLGVPESFRHITYMWEDRNEGSCWNFTPEIEDWCEAQGMNVSLHDTYFLLMSKAMWGFMDKGASWVLRQTMPMICFDNESDAVLFKLTWL